MKKQTKKQVAVNPAKESIEVDGIKFDEDIYWEGLIDAKNGVTKEILAQQQLVLELAKKHEADLKANPSTLASVEGLMKAIQDLATDIPNIMARHQVDGKFKEGKLDATNIDDSLEYLEIASQYISIGENLSNLISTAYLDIFARLSLPTDNLSATIKKGNKELKNALKGAPHANK